MRLKFAASDDGRVQARFDCDAAFEGYAGMLHGGVVASLLDGAMTNCMFAHGIPAVTAELTVRFRHPVRTGVAVTVRAWVERCSPPLHVLKAEVVQNGQLMATARGKFMDQARITKQRHGEE
ncbi:MAG: PaaI family thioesterase [Phycisphaerae bacterium]|nr:PaaI family thioesterase [Phycisphaerae bacterium]